jgi:hypothetical protein
MKTTNENSCNFCNYTTSDPTNYKKHLLTAKHKRLMNLTPDAKENLESTTISYYCECCEFSTRNKYDFNRHNHTKKHKQFFIIFQKTGDQEIVKEEILEKVEMEPKKETGSLNTELVIELLKQNKEIQNSLMEQNRELQNKLHEISQNTVINTTNNITNNQFNLNVFLNEDCKNALNIADFINSLKLTVNDIEETGKLGYTQGLTRIFIKALKDLDITMRPFHCTDIKRETVYIKDQDNWEKENAEKTKLRNVLKQIARKNLRMLPEWQEQNPEYRKLDTPENQQFMQISLSSLGSEYEEEQDKMEDRILKNVLKEVVIEKAKK